MATAVQEQKPDTQKPLLHRREDAARRLGISLRTLDELLALRELPSVKIGKRRLVTEAALEAFVRRAERAK